MIDSAIVLAAGLGTRLAPLSNVRAKAALPVAGEALIRRLLRWLRASGVRHVVVNLHHLPATITRVVGHGDDLGLNVRYSWEPVVLGSAGGPARAFDLLGADRAYIVNGDTLTDLDLHAIAAEHARHRPLVTLAVVDRRPGYNAVAATPGGGFAGVVAADHHGAPPDRALGHFIGVQVAERAAFAEAPRDTPSEVLRWLYPRLCADGAERVRVWKTSASYHDIGTPAVYLDTAATFARLEGRPLDRGLPVAIHQSADVTDSVLWDGVVVGPRAVIRGCVIGDGVIVPEGTRLERAAVVRLEDVVPGTPGHPSGSLWIAPFARPSA